MGAGKRLNRRAGRQADGGGAAARARLVICRVQETGAKLAWSWMRSCRRSLVPLGLLLMGGCQWFADAADRDVYRLVESRQRAALGEVHDAGIARGSSPTRVPAEAYSFVPHPVDTEVPEAFGRPIRQSDVSPSVASPPSTAATPGSAAAPASMPAVEGELPATQPFGNGPEGMAASQPASSRPARPIMTLADALRYAFQHSRRFQDAKEELYLAALDLTLERHLWTPRLFGELGADYINKGQYFEWDDALEAVAQAGIRQKLLYGGEVTARIVGNIVRDLTNHVSTGETGSMILEADIPLLRGAGRSAYESRYQAERNLIYAVRTFEEFRRRLSVTIAAEYFNLQGVRQQIINAHETVASLTSDQQRAEALWRTGRTDQLDVLRAEQDRIQAINGEVDAIADYETALDRFKILIGMPTGMEIDVEYPAEVTDESVQPNGAMEPASLEDALQMPDVSEEEAIRVALKYRLDLLNDTDRVDDARRGVAIAENNLLPDLRAFGTVQMDTQPEVDSVLGYNTERTSYRTGMRLELPLDRVAERNALRRSQINLQQAQRALDEAKDVIALEVRESIREVQQQMDSLRIQKLNRDTALLRRRSARLWFELGKKDNRDVVEAQKNLLDAQNRLAEAQSRLRRAILTFRLNTGTLRVDDSGQWYSPVVKAAESR